MGSTGSGSFTDYPSQKPKSQSSDGEDSSNASEEGSNNNDDDDGGNSLDNCFKAIASKLEEVARCDYYISTGGVPPVGTAMEIYFNKRIVARTPDGIDIGYLPTKYNYLKFCLDEGHSYEGLVTSSSGSPIPIVTVDIFPSR